jgi:hypothetical protein
MGNFVAHADFISNKNSGASPTLQNADFIFHRVGYDKPHHFLSNK